MLTFLDKSIFNYYAPVSRLPKITKKTYMPSRSNAETLITFAICSISSCFFIIKLEYVKGHTYFFEDGKILKICSEI